MFLFKVIVLVALVGAPALAGLTKGLEQQREEQIREEQPLQQQVLVKVEESGDRKLPQRSEAKGSGEEKKPLEIIKIEQERPQQQIEELETVKAAPASEQTEQVVREENKRPSLPAPIQQQQQRDESAQLEEPRSEQVQIKQELELPQKQEEIKGSEVRQLEHIKRQPEVLLRASGELTRVRSYATKESIDRRPTSEGLKSEHREEPRLESKPLPPVKTYARTYTQDAPKLYTFGRFSGSSSSSQYQDQYYQPPYSSQYYGYPYYQSQPSYGYSQPAYSYPQPSYSSYGSYYRAPSSTSYTTGGSYTRYGPQTSPASTPYLYPTQRQPVYVREYYLPAPSTSAYYQPPQTTAYSQPSSYRLHYSDATKTRRTAGLNVDEHTPVTEEQI